MLGYTSFASIYSVGLHALGEIRIYTCILYVWAVFINFLVVIGFFVCFFVYFFPLSVWFPDRHTCEPFASHRLFKPRGSSCHASPAFTPSLKQSCSCSPAHVLPHLHTCATPYSPPCQYSAGAQHLSEATSAFAIYLEKSGAAKPRP